MNMGLCRQGFRRILGLCALLLAAGWSTGCSVLETDGRAVADSTLVAAMADLYLIDTRADLGYEVAAGARDSVLARYGMDRAMFEAAIDASIEVPGRYAELYRRVLDRLAATRDGRLDSLRASSTVDRPPAE